MDLYELTIRYDNDETASQYSDGIGETVTNKFAEKGAVVSRAVELVTNEPPIQSAMYVYRYNHCFVVQILSQTSLAAAPHVTLDDLKKIKLGDDILTDVNVVKEENGDY